MESIQNSKQTLIDKYNCKAYYFKLVECVNKHEKLNNLDETSCREEFMNLGECIITGQKEEEKPNSKNNK